MRGAITRSHTESDEESAFISMTDMTVSFLLIVIILLAFFASQISTDKLQEDELIPLKQYNELIFELERTKNTVNELETSLTEQEIYISELETFEKSALEKFAHDANWARTQLVLALRNRLKAKFPELEIEISTTSDIVRLSGDMFFKTNSSKLANENVKAVVHAVAEGLHDLLPCFTLGTINRWNSECNPSAVLVEAVQIEGHTDSRGPSDKNLELSLMRGMSTFIEVEKHTPNILKHLNLDNQPVLSVAGYGETRPIAENIDDGLAKNRRIDLRFIMTSVAKIDEIVAIRKQLKKSINSASNDE